MRDELFSEFREEFRRKLALCDSEQLEDLKRDLNRMRLYRRIPKNLRQEIERISNVKN